VASLALASLTIAAPPDFILQIPDGQIALGDGAAELDNPRGMAGDPSTGHVYISDGGNSRISEYTAWGLFVKSWGWGVATGASELQTCGPLQPEASPPAALCQIGIEGVGKGQFSRPNGIAVDGASNVYVLDRANLRVQKFSPAGAFLLMFGGEVNKTTNGDICTQASGDECGKGTEGSGPSHLAGTVGNYIDYSPTENTILVGDKDRIQIFELDGTFKKEIPFEGPLAAFAGKSVNGLDVDKDGNVYFSLSGVEDVYKFDSAGVPLAPGKPGESSFEVGNPLGVAVDVEGGVYAFEQPGGTARMRVLKFDATGEKLIPTPEEEAQEEFFPYIPFSGPNINGVATNFCEGSEEPGSLYISFARDPFESYVDVYGTGPSGCEPPPPNPPEILAQYAISVGREEATVGADINPRFLPDATYYVEFGTGECSKGGCNAKQPLTAASLTSKSVNRAVKTAGVFLDGLEPATTYHYRFVAESSGGGPIFGEDPDGRGGPEEASVEAGIERTFRTFATPPIQPCAANQALRTRSSAKLPDCRAYEMVSPLDKGNGDVALWVGRNASVPRLFEFDRSAVSGGRFTFTSTTAFADPESSPFVSQYLSTRGTRGWAAESISPPHTESPVLAFALLSNEFHGFSDDLCTAWLLHYSKAPLAKEGIPGFANIYRRQNCSADAGSYEALSPVKPLNREPADYFGLRVQGLSADGAHAIFNSNGALDPDAPALAGNLELLLYEHTPEGLRFVCYLPNGTPSTKTCAAGTASGSGGGNESSVHNAISADGQRIFWSDTSEGNPGQIYVRIGGAETRKVSGSKASDPAWYWTAADDGSKAIFAFDSGPLKDQLYEFDVDGETSTLIAKEVLGPMGASEDASRVYFASKEDLDDTGPAVAGDRNLYLYDANADTHTLVMELSASDIGGTSVDPSPIDELPSQRTARVSPDGLHALFVSASPSPTGYDNLDAKSGEPDQEVYLYDAVEDELRCVSCNPSGARPTGEDIGTVKESIWVASGIQGWEILLHAPRVLSNDGTRAYFESLDALVPDDTNGAWDVYQWEELGKGGCAKAAQAFSEESQGCIDLISSGESPADSTFLDADPTGNNVFFGTQSSLVAKDYGLNDVYDARVDGGFSETTPKPICEGEACQSPPPPPPDVTPSSESIQGPGNPVGVKPKPRRCRKGTRRVRRKGKVRCVPKARANARRRAAR
jgi:NHL repeat